MVSAGLTERGRFAAVKVGGDQRQFGFELSKGIRAT